MSPGKSVWVGKARLGGSGFLALVGPLGSASVWAAGLRRRCKSRRRGLRRRWPGRCVRPANGGGRGSGWRRNRACCRQRDGRGRRRDPEIEVGRSSPCAAPRAARAAKASAARVLAWEGGFMMGSGNAKRPAGEGEPWIEGQGRRGALSLAPAPSLLAFDPRPLQDAGIGIIRRLEAPPPRRGRPEALQPALRRAAPACAAVRAASRCR